MAISTSSLHVDRLMTDVSLRYRNADFVAEEVFPVLPVGKQSDKYLIYGQENFRGDDDKRAPGAESDEANWTLSNDSYYCGGHAKSMVIPDEWVENEDEVVDVSTDVTEMLTEQIFLRREINAYNSVVAGVSTTVNCATSTQQWDVNTVDPVAKVDAQRLVIRKATGKKANRLLLSEPTFTAIRNNTLVKSRISGAADMDASKITSDMLAGIFDVEKVIVAGAVKATSAEGQTQTNDYVWGSTALLYYAPPSPGKRAVSLGYQMTWNKGRLGSLVYRFRLDTRHADKIEVMRYYDVKVVAGGAGVLFTNTTT